MGAWVYVAALAASFTVATVASPAGVSGAVLLLPFEVSVLGTPSSSVTPTNLLYTSWPPRVRSIATGQGQTGGRLTGILVLGTVPGVVFGSVIRVELLPGAMAFDVVIAAVLIPLGGWLILDRKVPGATVRLSPAVIGITSAIVGVVGGIYGIGGGSILAPLLVGSGRSPSEVAPATLASTFVTSIAG